MAPQTSSLRSARSRYLRCGGTEMFALAWQWSSRETRTQSDSTVQNDSVGLEKMRELNTMVGNFFFS